MFCAKELQDYLRSYPGSTSFGDEEIWFEDELQKKTNPFSNKDIEYVQYFTKKMKEKYYKQIEVPDNNNNLKKKEYTAEDIQRYKEAKDTLMKLKAQRDNKLKTIDEQLKELSYQLTGLNKEKIKQTKFYASQIEKIHKAVDKMDASRIEVVMEEKKLQQVLQLKNRLSILKRQRQRIADNVDANETEAGRAARLKMFDTMIKKAEEDLEKQNNRMQKKRKAPSRPDDNNQTAPVSATGSSSTDSGFIELGLYRSKTTPSKYRFVWLRTRVGVKTLEFVTEGVLHNATVEDVSTALIRSDYERVFDSEELRAFLQQQEIYSTSDITAMSAALQRQLYRKIRAMLSEFQRGANRNVQTRLNYVQLFEELVLKL